MAKGKAALTSTSDSPAEGGAERQRPPTRPRASLEARSGFHEDGYLTRAMLMDAAGITEHDMRSLCSAGVIKADKTNVYGWALYHESLVDKIQKYAPILAERKSKEPGKPTRFLPASVAPPLAYAADEATMVIERVEAGETLVKIFLDTKIHPAILNNIVKDYQIMSGSMLLPREAVDAINALPFEGAFPIETPRALVSMLKKNAAQLVSLSKCRQCKKRTCTHCLACAQKLFAPAAPPTEATGEDVLMDLASKVE